MVYILFHICMYVFHNSLDVEFSSTLVRCTLCMYMYTMHCIKCMTTNCILVCYARCISWIHYHMAIYSIYDILKKGAY